MEKFRGIHAGKRAFIACNGPSLNDTPVQKLKHDIVFGLNRGYLRKGLPITYLVVVNDLVERQFSDEMRNYASKHCKAFFTNNIGGANCHRMLWTPDSPKFTGDPTKPMWQGHTVTFAAMQLAYFMGVKTLYLIGCDHSFTNEGSVRKKGERGRLALHDDPNHFSPDYYGKGVRWDAYEPGAVERAYLLATKAYRKVGRKIWNASAHTKLPESVIPRIDFDTIEFRSE